MTLDSAPDVLTVTEAARLLRIGRNAAYDLIRDGRLRAVRVGARKLLVPKAALLDFLDDTQPGNVTYLSPHPRSA